MGNFDESSIREATAEGERITELRSVRYGPHRKLVVKQHDVSVVFGGGTLNRLPDGRLELNAILVDKGGVHILHKRGRNFQELRFNF